MIEVMHEHPLSPHRVPWRASSVPHRAIGATARRSAKESTQRAGMRRTWVAGMTIPPLELHCGSWIVTAPDGHVVELFKRANVERAAQAGWRIETAVTYLGRINAAYRKARRENETGE